jgi:hypothetical protein
VVGHLLEMFQPFAANGILEEFETRDVAARSGEALDEATAERIGDGREYDRYGAGRLQQRPDGRAASGQDDVRRERD